jgi:long-chain acyl-CoA synthetase
MEALVDRKNFAKLLLTKRATMTSVWASVKPNAIAVYDPSGRTRTFGEINANANRIARLLRHSGLGAGDAAALLCSNRAEFVEVLAATLRTGIRVTPVNWHLTPEEIAYIVDSCEAKAFFADARVSDAARHVIEACPALRSKMSIGGPIHGFDEYEDVLAGFDPSDLSDPVPGSPMLYTSGTTGRPKGVFRPNQSPAILAAAAATMIELREYDQESVQMCAGPAYHAAPLTFDVRLAMDAGVPLVFIDKWDTEHVLRTIAEKKVTHMHMVPIMFQRLLALPAHVRAKYDVSHVKYILHGAAPCPPDVKHAIIEWFGPVVNEYYAGSEGGAGFTITSEEWLRRPGSVGKPRTSAKIFDEEGNECAPGTAGTIYHQLPEGGFEYFKDPAKTEASRRGDYFTLGDIGYFDAEGFLFLTGRSAEVIIAGGVNIYPQEVDNELIKHPAVADCATVGVPNEEWGEEVKAVILLEEGYRPSDALAQEIVAFGRDRLAAYKAPRSIDFVGELPRTEAGKIQRHKVRAKYWAGRARQI